MAVQANATPVSPKPGTSRGTTAQREPPRGRPREKTEGREPRRTSPTSITRTQREKVRRGPRPDQTGRQLRLVSQWPPLQAGAARFNGEGEQASNLYEHGGCRDPKSCYVVDRRDTDGLDRIRVSGRKMLPAPRSEKVLQNHSGSQPGEP